MESIEEHEEVHKACCRCFTTCGFSCCKDYVVDEIAEDEKMDSLSALHIAIAKNNTYCVETLLNYMSKIDINAMANF